MLRTWQSLIGAQVPLVNTWMVTKLLEVFQKSFLDLHSGTLLSKENIQWVFISFDQYWTTVTLKFVNLAADLKNFGGVEIRSCWWDTEGKLKTNIFHKKKKISSLNDFVLDIQMNITKLVFSKIPAFWCFAISKANIRNISRKLAGIPRCGLNLFSMFRHQ